MVLTALPPSVRELTLAYLECVDDLAAGLVEGLYLTGSVALGDFQRGGMLARRGPSGATSSNVDFVAVISRSTGLAEIAALSRAHEELRRRFGRPYMSGLYVKWNDLALEPFRLWRRRYPYVREGRLRYDDRAEPSPAVWHELAEYGVAVRGPDVGNRAIWTDPEMLALWCRVNLADYWLPWLRRSSNPLDLRAAVTLTDFGSAWPTLGVSCSHHTISTGALISKTDAASQARSTFGPRWHRLLDESLRIHTSSSRRSFYPNPLKRRRETLHFVAMVMRRHALLGKLWLEE